MKIITTFLPVCELWTSDGISGSRRSPKANVVPDHCLTSITRDKRRTVYKFDDTWPVSRQYGQMTLKLRPPKQGLGKLIGHTRRSAAPK